MENNKNSVNWEKIGVYIAITIGLLTMIVYLFQIKDDICSARERITRLEVKIER